MKRRKIGSLVVVAKKTGEPIGLVTKTDLLFKSLAAGKPRAKVSDVVSTPLVTIDVGADVSDAAKVMNAKGVKRLLVTRGDRVVGIVSQKDMVRVSPSLYDLIAESRAAGWEPEYLARVNAARKQTMFG
jgi:CBS domain-containing protein